MAIDLGDPNRLTSAPWPNSTDIPQIASWFAEIIPQHRRQGYGIFLRPRDDLISRFSCVGKPICAYFQPSRHTSRVAISLPSIPSAYAGTGLRRRSSIRPKIFWNKLLGTATSANWNVTYRPWRTTLAPILTSFSRSVVSDQCSTSFGKASVRMKLARL